MEKIRLGIAGYGNIGRGVEKVIKQNPDMRLAAVFTRRDPSSIGIADKSVVTAKIDDAAKFKNDVDVVLLCGGSATDLPEQGPYFASIFNTVDCFDTHAKIPEYLDSMNRAATHTAAVVSSGWDPGLFSIMRSLCNSVLPQGSDYTFWGNGVSQGHSDAIRRVPGVKNAVQYTIPIESAVESVRNGENPALSPKDKHIRECYVAAAEGADTDKIRSEIVNMPNYFAGYNTVVHFVSEEEVAGRLTRMPHGGFVFRSGDTGGNKHIIELSLRLDSNPEFTASAMVCCARAAYRLAREKNYGAKTVLNIPLTYLSPKERGELIKDLV